MKLIVGLGNPGKEYEKTRHNVGFMVMDCLADDFHVSINTKKFKGECQIKISRGRYYFTQTNDIYE